MARLIPGTTKARSRRITRRANQYQLLARHASRGSALVWALIFVLVLLGTAVAISRRGFFGLVGSSFVRDSKLAREAAEIGILRTAALLNEPRNRRLLVNAPKLNSRSESQLESDPNLISDCQTAKPDLSMALGRLKSGNSYPVITIDSERTYQIISITQPNTSSERTASDQKNSSFALAMGTSNTNAIPGEISITVKGTAKRGSSIVGEFTLTRILEVLPKCCGLSLGGKSNAFGNDSRQCGGNDPGLGLIAGTYYKDNGDFDITGSNGIQFFSDTAKTTPIANVYCIDTSSANDCLDGDGTLKSGTGTQLKESGATINDVPISLIDPKGCNDGTSQTNSSDRCVVEIDQDLTLSTSDFTNWGSSDRTITLYSSPSYVTFTTSVPSISYSSTTLTNTVIICSGKDTPISKSGSFGCANANDRVTLSGTNSFVTSSAVTVTVPTQTSTLTSTFTGTSVIIGGGSINATVAKLKGLCDKDVATSTTYCSLDRLILDNNRKLIFDTTGGPIRIYFRDSSGSSAPSITLRNGSSGLGQIKTGVTDPPYADMALLGMSIAEAGINTSCPAPSVGPCQYAQLGGGNSGSTNFFAYFPSATVELQGSTTINGMIWANTIKPTGSVDFISTSSGVGSVLSYLGIKNQDAPGDQEPIFKEFVTRLSKRFRFF